VPIPLQGPARRPESEPAPQAGHCAQVAHRVLAAASAGL